MPASTPSLSTASPRIRVRGSEGWLIELASCASTNSWALRRLAALPAGTCVWTRRQTRGRGRCGRRWYSPRGVLTASFVCDLDPSPDASLIALAAALAVVHTIEDLVPGVRLAIKWPNDCLIGDQKVAGILCEGSLQGRRQRMVVGIGLDLAVGDQDLAELRALVDPDGPCPTSLCAHVAPEFLPCPLDVLQGLRRYLREGCALLDLGRHQALLAQVGERDWLRGRGISVNLPEGAVLAGQASGIDDRGRLLLLLAEGGSVAVTSGQVRLLAHPAPSTRESARSLVL